MDVGNVSCWKFKLLSWDPSSQIVYPARVRMVVMQTDGEIVAVKEDPTRHRFDQNSISLVGDEAAFIEAIGNPNQPVVYSFIVRAEIHAQRPYILSPKCYEHCVKLSTPRLVEPAPAAPTDDASVTRWWPFLVVAGYCGAKNRLIAWKAGDHEVRCLSLHPLVSLSARELCHVPRLPEARLCAALSRGQRFSAVIMQTHMQPTIQTHFYVVDLENEQLVHDRHYTTTEQPIYIDGLAHTVRGWLAWSHWTVWSVAEEMQMLLNLDDHQFQILFASYKFFYVVSPNEEKLLCWDLSSEQMAVERYDFCPSIDFERFECKFVVDDELYVAEFDRLDWRLPASLCLSSVRLQGTRCFLNPVGVFNCNPYTNAPPSYFIIDGARVMLANEQYKINFDDALKVQICWQAIPTGKELAVMAIQKRTGSKQNEFWQGGLTEEEVKQILDVKYKNSNNSVNVMN